jgi:hypothetical protein
MNTNWLKRRQTKFAAFATIYILVILAVLTVLNILGNRYDKSYDSTKNKLFSLSEQTIKIVKGLKQDVTLTYFGSEDSFRTGRDLLDRYSDLSPKLHVKYIAPDKNPQLARAAGYRADSPVIVDSGTHKEGAKTSTEEEVTGALIRALKPSERNVCFVSGFGEHSIDDTERNGFSYTKQLLEHDNYKSRAVTLKPAAPDAGKPIAIGQTVPAAAVDVPKDCTVLVSGGPQEAYPPPVADAIKKYVEGGGRAMIMLDNVIRLGRSEPAADWLGRHRRPRPGAGWQRPRPDLRLRSGDTRDHAVREPPDHAAVWARHDGLSPGAIPGHQGGRDHHRRQADPDHGGQPGDRRHQRYPSRRHARPQEGQAWSVHPGRRGIV